MPAKVRCPCRIVKFKIITEHVEQMLLKTHHQWMHPCIEQHIRAFKAHLRRIARGKILHMDGSRNDSTGNAQPLGNIRSIWVPSTSSG